MKRINLREYVQQLPAALPLDIDEGQCLVRGVKLLGWDSRNGRRYVPEGVSESLYDGAKVNIDHPDGAGGSRRFSDRFGRIVNARKDKDGLWGDVKYNPDHAQAKAFLWWCKNDPGAVGMSHNALGDVKESDDGTLIVTGVVEVYSVDLVADAATTKGLQESHMDPLDLDAGMNKEPEPGQEGYEAHIGKLVAAIVTDQALSVEEKRKKILMAVKLLDDGQQDSPVPAKLDEEGDDDSSEDADDTPSDEEEEEEAMESLRAENRALKAKVEGYELRERNERRRVKALSLCKEHLPEHLITPVFVEALVAAKDRETVRSLIEDRKATAGVARPISIGSHQPITESRNGERARPADEVASSLRR